jgi:hypothetical protein
MTTPPCRSPPRCCDHYPLIRPQVYAFAAHLLLLYFSPGTVTSVVLDRSLGTSCISLGLRLQPFDFKVILPRGVLLALHIARCLPAFILFCLFCGI